MKTLTALKPFKDRLAVSFSLLIGLACAAQAQISLNLSWSVRNVYLSSELEPRVTYYSLAPSLQLARGGPFANARIVNPRGDSGLYTPTGGGFSGVALTSAELLAQSITGLWTLTTNYGFGNAHTYTFSLSVDSIALDPIYFTAPDSFTNLSNPLTLAWAGAVNDGPLVLNIDGFNPLNDQRHNLPVGATAWTGPIEQDSYTFLVTQAAFRPVDFVTVSTPIDENGNALPQWSVTERAIASALMPYPRAAAVPEPSTWFAGAALAGLMVFVRRMRT